jgi:uncharacterized protein
MKNQARKGLLIYFTVLIVGSSVIEWLLIKTGDAIKNHVTLVFLLMWTPAIASFVARVALREGFHDVSFRLGGRLTRKSLLVGWFFPLAVGTIAYGIAWSTGLALFITQAVPGLPTFDSQLLSFLLLALIRLSIGVIIAAIAAAGEEIGWRGFMLTRLIQAGVRRPLLVSGLIWGLWHTPLIMTGQYASGPYPIVSAALFIVVIVAESFLLARLRLESGSVWPCIFGHAAWNSTIQGIFDFSSAGPSGALWIGESGILVVVMAVVLVWFLVRGKWPRLGAPNEPLREEAA